MTDEVLVARKLKQIEIWVNELKTMARPAEIHHDVREERFVKHTLQIAIQCAIDVAVHIVADESLGLTTDGYRGYFQILGSKDWLPQELADRLSSMAGFRNLLVHQYGEIDLGKVERILAQDVDDLLAFTAAIRARIQ
jgi:uncharacterized protein YutE (UPF0331/DUF86 family)